MASIYIDGPKSRPLNVDCQLEAIVKMRKLAGQSRPFLTLRGRQLPFTGKHEGHRGQSALRLEAGLQGGQPFNPGNEPEDGVIYLKGPHYPSLHSWYAKAELKDGILLKFSSTSNNITGVTMKNIETFQPQGEKPTQEEIEECKARQKNADEYDARMRRENIRTGIIVVSLILFGGIYFGDWKWSDFDISFNLIEVVLLMLFITAFFIVVGFLFGKLNDYLDRR